MTVWTVFTSCITADQVAVAESNGVLISSLIALISPVDPELLDACNSENYPVDLSISRNSPRLTNSPSMKRHMVGGAIDFE